jgi:hypothetical protein
LILNASLLANKEYEFRLQIADKIKSLENQTVEINELVIVHTQEESLVNILKV